MRFDPRIILAFALVVVQSIELVAGAESRPSRVELQQVSEAYLGRRPAPGLSTGMTYRAALEVQKEYVSLLEATLGERAGYKVGLVTAAGQKRFQIAHPIRGVLFQKMLRPDGGEVPVNYATRPILEPDLLVRVKDADINEARTTRDVLEHLAEVICFMELADGTFAEGVVIDAGVLTASNVGARLGVMGDRRTMVNSEAFHDALGKMELVLRDGAGKELSRVSADGVMGHPFKAVLWLVEDLKKTGEKLEAGDVVSLGSPSPQVTPKSGEGFVLVYEGLPGGELKARISFK